MDRTPSIDPYRARRRKSDPSGSEAHAHRRIFDNDATIRLHDRVDDHDSSIKQINAVLGVLVPNMEKLISNSGRVADALEGLDKLNGFWWTLKLFSGVFKVLLPFVLFVAALAAAIWLFARTGQWDFRL